MKTAISVPDQVFERARHHADRLGMSRSEFFSRAAERWADELEETELTEAINEAVEQVRADEEEAFVRRAARRLLARPDADQR